MYKKILLFILMCLIAFWVGKIYQVNKNNAKRETVYSGGEPVEYGGLNIVQTSAFLYDFEDFERIYGENSEYEGTDKIICIALNVTNDTGNNILWDDVLTFLYTGFETDTWVSSASPSLGCVMNVLKGEFFETGSTQKLWIAAAVNSESFKDKTWNNLSKEKFYYVLAGSDDEILIKLDTEEK